MFDKQTTTYRAYVMNYKKAQKRYDKASTVEDEIKAETVLTKWQEKIDNEAMLLTERGVPFREFRLW